MFNVWVTSKNNNKHWLSWKVKRLVLGKIGKGDRTVQPGPVHASNTVGNGEQEDMRLIVESCANAIVTSSYVLRKHI